MTVHTILMGDPERFRIKGGLNPYTRNQWGFKKCIDRARAVYQWQGLKELLESLGVRVFVLPPDPDLPGLVYPANAGFLHPKYEVLPFSKKTFFLSNLAGHRLAEQVRYRSFMSSLGCAVETMPYAFEGEADFFPCGEFFIFTFGTIRKTGFRPHPGWPPYRFQFSHRSDERNGERLQSIVGPKTVIKVRLTDVRYYHGDTCLFAFGTRREYLLAYLDAMDEESGIRLKHHLGSRLIPISQQDAEQFAANSFQVDSERGPHLFFPMGVSEALKSQIQELGYPFSTVDVSEFLAKGGGSIKCLLCDLGPVAA